MLDLITAILTLYVGYSTLVAFISLLIHWVPVLYALKESGSSAEVVKYPKIASFSYFMAAFMAAPTITLPCINPHYSKLFKKSLFEFLKT